jgi:hypothetical protein
LDIGLFARKTSTTKRETLKSRNATFYAKRTARGQFKEVDEKGRSLRADRRTKAGKRTASSGHGDQGDRRRAA